MIKNSGIIYPLVLVVGCDKTGKTTLINNLVLNMNKIDELLGGKGDSYAVWKGVKPVSSEQAMRTASMLLDTVVGPYSMPLILDRFNIPDEWVYSTALKKLISDEVKEMYELAEYRLWNRGVLVIYCEASSEDIVERFETENEKDVPVAAIRAIQEKYEDWLEWTSRHHVPILRLNSSANVEETLTEAALAAITGQEVDPEFVYKGRMSEEEQV